MTPFITLRAFSPLRPNAANRLDRDSAIADTSLMEPPAFVITGVS
jgi:hypothetical protein